jgi:sirohydrochlorin cobaltochelatase
MKQALLIMAHGSRDAAARVEYRRLADAVAARLPEWPVAFGVLEFPGGDLDSISIALQSCLDLGVDRVVALPYFLFSAGHVRDDLPGELCDAAAGPKRPRLAYQPPLGVDRRLLNAFEGRAAEALTGLPAVDGLTALLLVGAGTSDPDSNADLFRAARLLWERRSYPLVEVAFVSLTEPSIDDAVRRCQALGARRVVLTPYFLNTGVLSRRIDDSLAAARAELPGLELVVSAEIGLHPELLELLVERARRGLADGLDGLRLPPCAEEGGPWSCWFARSGEPG